MNTCELVSVVIPVRNGKHVLGTQLEALSVQDYDGAFEVVIADNGSQDGLTQYLTDEGWHERLDLRVVDASDAVGAAHARNTGASQARGEILLFCDADDQVHPDFVRRMVDSFADVDVLTAGVEDSTLNPPGLRKLTRTPAPEKIQPEGLIAPCVAGGAFGARATVYADLGGMSEEWPSHEDIEFGWRAHQRGFRVRYLAEALVGIRYRQGLRANMRQGVEWGTSMARLHATFPGNGLPPIRLAQQLVTLVELAVFCWKFTPSEWGLLAGLWYGRTKGALRYRSGA